MCGRRPRGRLYRIQGQSAVGSRSDLCHGDRTRKIRSDAQRPERPVRGVLRLGGEGGDAAGRGREVLPLRDEEFRPERLCRRGRPDQSQRGVRNGHGRRTLSQPQCQQQLEQRQETARNALRNLYAPPRRGPQHRCRHQHGLLQFARRFPARIPHRIRRTGLHQQPDRAPVAFEPPSRLHLLRGPYRQLRQPQLHGLSQGERYGL